MDDDEQVGVEDDQDGADGEGEEIAAQDGFGVAGDEGGDGQGRDDVGDIEIQMLGDGHEQDVKQDNGQADEEVLDGMNLFFVDDFGQKEGGKGENDKHEGIFGQADGFLIDVGRNQEFEAERRVTDLMLISIPGLREISIQVQHVPGRGESFVGNIPGDRQKGSVKAGGGPGGPECDAGGFTNGDKLELFAAVEIKLQGKSMVLLGGGKSNGALDAGVCDIGSD